MQLKSFIILLYISTMRANGMSDMIRRDEVEGQVMKCGGVNVSVGDEKVLAKYLEIDEKNANMESRKVVDLKVLSAKSTMLNISKANAQDLNSISERRYPDLEKLTTRPSALFNTASKPFNIVEQLKLDEIREAQEMLLLKHGHVKASNKKKKRKRKKNKNKQKPIGEEATIFWTQLTTKKPHYYYQQLTTTTKLPKKIKYIVRKHNVLKKKKKEYLNHLKHVVYPFIKFIAFFTVLNPFTLKVFFFALISPVVFGFLGFMALSFMVKPALHLIFDVKKRADIIKRQHWREKKRRERWRYGRRPITVHKHYYKNVVAPHPMKLKPKPVIVISRPPSPAPLPPPSWPAWLHSDQIDFRPKLQTQIRRPPSVYKVDQHRIRKKPTHLNFNPLLPEVSDEIEDWPYGPTQFENFIGTKSPKFGGERISSTSLLFKRPTSTVMKRGSTRPPHFYKKHEAVPVSASSEFDDAPFI